MSAHDSLAVESWPLDRVIPYEKNPRSIPPAAVEKVAASIREFGFRQPIVVDEAGVIIAGHTRRLAAIFLGLEAVPVHIARGLTDEQARAYRLADNRTGEEAIWDEDTLRAEIAALQAQDFDLELLGFDGTELDEIMAEPTAGETDPDDTPEVEVAPVSALGDVWLLGSHRLACGDSTEAATVEAALGGAEPRLMVTDPPYGVNYDPSWRGVVKRQDGSRVGVKARGLVENDDRADWTEAWALFPGDVAYVWHGGLHATTVADSLMRADFQMRSQIIWRKQTFIIGRGDYHWQHEPCWYAVRKGGKGWWAGDRKQATVWDINVGLGYHQKKTGPDAHTGIHSTQKPVECMKRPMENNSRPGDHVYEPFSGSGTTIIASEMTGRRCCAIELNPLYVDVAIRRWEAFAGRVATLEATGQTFDEVRRERGAEGPAPTDA